MRQQPPAAEIPDSDDLNVGLQQTEERFDTLVAGVEDYAIFLLSPKGHIISWNSGAQRIKGYESREIIGRHFSVFYTREAIERDRPGQVLRIAATEGKFTEEGWRVRKDGSLFWGSVTVTALRNQNGSLRGFLKITRDLTERQKIEALQKADRTKDIFLATVSHEFRTHLNAILGWTSLMKESPTDEALISQGLDVLQRNSITLSRLVEDLVDISKIAAGALTLEFEELDLKQIVVSSVESLRLKAVEKGIVLKSIVEIPEDVECRVWGAEVRLQQILANILSNSLKFTPEQGSVTVILKTAQGRAIVVVKDTGVGILPEFLPHAFELFAQGKLGVRANRGMGLGLPICKHLVEAHQGTISIASDGPGRGTTVKVELPLLAPTPPRSIECKEIDALAKEEVMPETRLEKIKVLAVDDDADARDFLRIVLERAGADATVIDSGEEALKAIEELRPDVLICDLGMPKMDGYELLENVRRLETEIGWLPTIAFTASAREEDRLRTRRANFQAHLAKPVTPSELVKTVVELVHVKRQMNTAQRSR
jgi:hypothetical protein